MKASLFIASTVCILILAGCANREGVAPSQNSSLSAVSPSTTAASEGGMMQRSLDVWLKEEWSPLSTSVPVTTKTTTSDGTVITTKTEAAHVVTTTTSPDGTSVTTTAPNVPELKDNEPFTLQKYADKWKVYHENKAKMNEGKPKEPSHLDMMSSLPVVGK